MTETPLFDIDPSRIVPKPEPRPDPLAGLSAQQRRTLRQAADLAKGRHPVTGFALHADAAQASDRKADGRRCGNCVFRELFEVGRRTYAKCTLPDPENRAGGGRPYITHGPGTDLRAWWPACIRHMPVGGETVALKPKEKA